MRTIVATKPRTQPRDISTELSFLRTYNQPKQEMEIDPDEASYLQWKRENGLDKPLSRSEYDSLFHIYSF